MNISLAAEKVFSFFGTSITNSIFTGWLITTFLLVGAFIIGNSLKRIPSHLQNSIEMIYEYFYSSAENIVGRSDVVREIFPFIITLFFFILFSNWSGLLPGFGTVGVQEIVSGKMLLVPLLRAPTSDLNTTVGLAVLTIFYIQYISIKFSGLKAYVTKFLNFQNPISFFVGIIEFMSEFMRIISFSFRLFGNVFAGEVLIGVIFYLTLTLVPYIAILPLPFFVLELFVGVIQAFIFCFLTLIFTSLAVVSHDAHGNTHGGEEMGLSKKAAYTGHELEQTILHS